MGDLPQSCQVPGLCLSHWTEGNMGQRQSLYGEDKIKRGGKNKRAKTLERKRKASRDPSIISHLFPSGKWMLTGNGWHYYNPIYITIILENHFLERVRVKNVFSMEQALSMNESCMTVLQATNAHAALSSGSPTEGAATPSPSRRRTGIPAGSPAGHRELIS